jgi:hypothetical protein
MRLIHLIPCPVQTAFDGAHADYDRYIVSQQRHPHSIRNPPKRPHELDESLKIPRLRRCRADIQRSPTFGFEANSATSRRK